MRGESTSMTDVLLMGSLRYLVRNNKGGSTSVIALSLTGSMRYSVCNNGGGVRQ